jgi:hypothetical protein
MRSLLSGLLLAMTIACGGSPLVNGQPSAEALARELLAAFEQRSDHRLRALAVSESEFEQHIWPSLPAARPERNIPWTYVWGDLRQKSDLSLERLLRLHGSQAYRFESVRFAGETSGYAQYRIHRQAVIAVRDVAGGRRELRLLGSMIEKDGRWKVFSFVADSD